MKNLYNTLTLLLIALSVQQTKAAHLVGGEISYTCQGSNDYQITLIIYRDCFSTGAPFDQSAVITIYDDQNNQIMNLGVPKGTQRNLPLVAPNNCTQLPNNVCTERAIYQTTVNLPPIAGGYTITHQRCCRNNTISNIPTPGTWGNTYTTKIPSNDTGCNNSPKFNSDPPVVLCLSQKVSLDLSATDLDGDSLHYELCSPLHGGGTNPSMTGAPNSPAPNPASPPPYTNVPYTALHSTTYPIPSAGPRFAINPTTGMLEGRPNQVGQFVFAICVSEWRNGVRLSTTRRDFQFNVSGSCKGVISLIKPQDTITASLCTGKTIAFENKSSNASTYLWDFGDPHTNADTSTLKYPTYTYTDTGTYTVRLIADPGSACADTNYQVFKVFDPLLVEFEIVGDHCFETNSFNFQVSSLLSSTATYSWDFGGVTTAGTTSNVQEPTNISWLTPGVKFIELTVDDFICTKQFYDTIVIYPNPTLRHLVKPAVECVPYTAEFKDSSNAMTPIFHMWSFGDGEHSTDPDPVHVYNKPGTYSVKHTIYTYQGCIDSASESFSDIIVVHPNPTSGFNVTPDVASIYDPVFTMVNQSEGHIKTETLLPDSTRLEDMQSYTLTFDDTGTYQLVHISYNQFGCTDTAYKSIRVKPELNLFIPNAFSPNGDGINDEFRVEITGIRKYEIRIFNRWGELMYLSNDIEGGWNGRKMNKGPEVVPPGIYTYRIVVETIENLRDITKFGDINLLR